MQANGDDRLPTDEQLMLDFHRGSIPAFEELFSRYKQPLFGFFRRRLTDPSHAEELTQDTFVAVLRASARYQPTALFRTWFYAIGFKILRTHRRKTAFRATFFGERSHEPTAPNSVEIDLLLRDGLGKLDAHDREILMLREFEQLSYAEIAELLEMPVNTVRTRLFRARLALRDLLSRTAPAAKFAESTLEERV